MTVWPDVRPLLALALAALIAGARTAAADPVEETWLSARAGLPAGVASDYALIGTVRDLSLPSVFNPPPPMGRATPGVIVLHGCSGIGREEEALLYQLTLAGYAVFIPDSFARPGREPLCRPSSAAAAVDPLVYGYRAQELAFALGRVADYRWLDRSRLFLLGFSEGAAAAAQYRGDVFAGVVIIGWHCQGSGVLSGLHTPPGTPVLAMIMERDPWYADRRGAHCGQQFGARSGSASLTMPGDGHSVLSEARVGTGKAAKRALLRFLRESGR